MDSTLDGTSSNAISNSAVSNALNGKSDTSHTHTVSDVTDFPTLATVATSGSYNDLSNKPTIPTVNDATLTIQQNGVNVQTFTANQSTNATANIQCVDLTSNQTIGGNKTFSNGLFASKSAQGDLAILVDDTINTSNEDENGFPLTGHTNSLKIRGRDNNIIPCMLVGQIYTNGDTGAQLRTYKYKDLASNAMIQLRYIYNDEKGIAAFSNISNITPNVTNTTNLGSPSLQWNSTYTRNILIDNDINIASSVINKTSNSGTLALRGGTNPTDGASIGLYGKDYIGALSGCVYITAYGNSDNTNFRIFPNGTISVYNNSTATTKNVAMQEDVNTLLNDKANSSHTHTKSEIIDFPTLATVATSGSYNDLTNKPTIPVIDSASIPFHNSYPRCKYLGTTITDAQNTAIKNRTYDDLFIGDYWTINGVNWRIVAIDYYYNVGDTNFDKGNVVVMPDTILYSAQMNTTNTTAGAYSGSVMRRQNLNSARTIAQNALGSHLANHRILLENAASWAWYDSDGVELPNEVQIYGTRVWSSALKGFSVATQKQQFPLLALAPQFVNTRQDYWLQDVSSSSASATFAHVNNDGSADTNNASLSFGVRPAVTLSYI